MKEAQDEFKRKGGNKKIEFVDEQLVCLIIYVHFLKFFATISSQFASL